MGALGNLLGGGGLGNLPIIGGMLGVGSGGNSVPQMPIPSAASPGYGPQAWPGWPVPQFAGGAPKQNFQGDFGKPGPGEVFFSQNASKYGAPGVLPGWYSQNQGKFGGSGPADDYWAGLSGKWNAPGVSQNSQTAWNQFNQQVPTNTDPYYDNAVRLATRDINSQMAAKGLLGGGTSMNPVREAITNIRAQQALGDSQYQLQRAGLAGNLAQGADATSNAARQGQLAWLTGLGGLGLGVQNADLARLMAGAGVAGNVDAGELARLNAGMNAGLGAEAAMANRGQNFFNNNLMMGNALSSPMQNIFMQQMAAQLGLTQQQIQTALGYGTTAANQSANNQANSEQGIMNLFSLFGGGGKGGILGGI
jgi:hypothetical protein